MHNYGKVPLKEHNNQMGGRTGSGVKKLPGPVKRVASNPTTGGGINRATRKP
jgi:hypothetical protein